MTVEIVHLRAVGIPAPKGSARAMLIAGKPRVIASGSTANQNQLRDWRQAVINACAELELPLGHPLPAFDRRHPLAIGVVWRLAMRAGDLGDHGVLPKATALAAHGRDCDKLERATWDAITQSGRIWHDDARVAVPLGVRRYVAPGEWLGAEIVVGVDVGRVFRWTYDQWKRAEVDIDDAKARARDAGARSRSARRAPNQGDLLAPVRAMGQDGRHPNRAAHAAGKSNDDGPDTTDVPR